MPLLSPSDRDRKNLLALSQEDMDDVDDSDLAHGVRDAFDLVRQQQEDKDQDDDENNLEEYEDDDYDEDDDETTEEGKVKLHFVPFGQPNSSGKVIEVHRNKRDKASESILKQLSKKYTHMFKRHLSEGIDQKKIVYLRDYGGIHDQFSKILLNSLVDAVADLKQKGHHLIMIASHCQRTKKLDDDYPDILNMRRISVLPSLQDENQLSEWTLVMKQDEARRIKEINAKQLLAMYNHKSTLAIKAENQGDLLNDLLAMDDFSISKAIWSPYDVDRRVTAAIGHALEQNKTSLDLEDFEAANLVVDQYTNMIEKSSTKLTTLARDTLKLEQDGSIDLAHLKKSCNDFERKLLTRVVDGSKCDYIHNIID